MKWFLLLISAFLLTSCVPDKVTPVFVVRYPNTWTPAPTPTFTPLPPTATLVIQQTRQAATRDPKVRILPDAPRGGIGMWLDTTDLPPDAVALLAPRAQVLIAADAPAARNPNRTVFARLDSSLVSEQEPLNPRFDGILVENVDPQDTSTLASIRAEIAPRLVIVGAELTDAASAASLFTVADGICFCNFLRASQDSPDQFKTAAEWKRDIDALAALSADPESLILTATRFPDDAARDFARTQTWFDYALASFLLGVNNDHTFFGFQGKAAQEFLGSSALVAELGSPVGDYFQANAVYQRRFTRGLVLVNPGEEPHAFALPRNYETPEGNRLAQVNLAPHSALILLSVE